MKIRKLIEVLQEVVAEVGDDVVVYVPKEDDHYPIVEAELFEWGDLGLYSLKLEG